MVRNIVTPLGMERFDCQSKLLISCKWASDNKHVIIMRFQHLVKHKPYYNVMMSPEAMEMIWENLEWCTPSSLVPKIQSLFPSVTAYQIHTTWTNMSKTLWKWDAEHPDEVDVLNVTIKERVVQLCWAQKHILSSLKGKIVGMPLVHHTYSSVNLLISKQNYS